MYKECDSGNVCYALTAFAGTGCFAAGARSLRSLFHAHCVSWYRLLRSRCIIYSILI